MSKKGEDRTPDPVSSDKDLEAILDVLLHKGGHDFRCCKKGTLVRRIRRRMGLANLSAFSDYLRFLSEHPQEVSLLKKDLLIGVTEFFRQPKAWKVLQEKAVSTLIELEDALRVTREELQSTIEQLESSNDQLRASNEEVTAANEELRSANEELESSKEELQSLNEELNTINSRLQEKVEELEGTNNDVTNLLSSTHIATVFLDKELHIKRYTPAGTRHFSLIPSDVGRSISDVLQRSEDDALLKDSRQVLAELTPASKEVRGDDDRYYIRRITPYRTQDDRIEGVVVTFVDVSDLKQTEQALRESNQRAEWLARFPEENPNPVVRVSAQGQVLYRNPAAAELPGWACDPGKPLPDPLRPMVDRAMVQGLEMQGEINFGGRFYFVTITPFPAEQYANLYGRDITDRKRAEEALRKSEQSVRLKLETILSPEGDIGKLDLADIIDAEAIQSLMNDFYKLAKIPMSIVDLEGKVLVGVGWQEICTKFHRAHPETCNHCIESDTQLSAGIPPGESRLYKCRNNMWDIATPILVGGKHMGNIFSGQFFFEGEDLDQDFFRTQARRYGFDEKEYIAAMEAVPRLSRESVDTGMAFFMKLSDMISKLSYGNIELARALAQQDALMDSLNESRKDLNRAQAVAKTGSWRLNVRKNRLVWSDETYRIFEIPGEAPLIYEAFLSAVYPEDRESVDRKWAAAIKGEPYDIEHRIVAGGAVKCVREKAELEFDPEGNLLGGFGTVQDVTERKRTEEALARAMDKLENTLNSITGGYYALDNRWRFIQANHVAEEHFGMLRDQLIGRIIWEITGTPPDSPVYRKFHEAMAGPKAVHFEAQSRMRPGFWSEMHLYPRDGLLEVYFSDISKRKQMEEELRRSRDELEIRVQERTTELKHRAEQLSLLASELTLTEERERRRLAEILHDHLQQLLVGARLSLESLSPEISKDRQQTFKNICNLLMESIETSRSLTAELSPPILYQRGLTAALEWLSRWMLDKYELNVKLEVDHEIGIAQEDMMVLLFQSVRELLFNVVKHARINTAEVRVSRDDSEHLRIVVRDLGQGFDPDRMWQDGEQACGYGMFTIRERLELLGGRLEVESAPGKGASFALIAPLGKVEPRLGGVERKTASVIDGTDAEVTPSKYSFKIEDRIRLMLVDDHIVMRQGLSIMLNAHPDIEIVAEAADGETAVQLARKLNPDVILMDISMPKMNGIEATRIIHSELPEIRVIGLSMFEDSDIASSVFEAGAAAYLTKAGNTEGLLEAIREGRVMQGSDIRT